MFGIIIIIIQDRKLGTWILRAIFTLRVSLYGESKIIGMAIALPTLPEATSMLHTIPGLIQVLLIRYFTSGNLTEPALLCTKPLEFVSIEHILSNKPSTLALQS